MSSPSTHPAAAASSTPPRPLSGPVVLRSSLCASNKHGFFGLLRAQAQLLFCATSSLQLLRSTTSSRRRQQLLRVVRSFSRQLLRSSAC
ncbi:hypothetical protein SESBI_35971 [Sesbania bispinosa]|nr:hypothetical protein SESBI_35971 [Sesbania bispinosa]